MHRKLAADVSTFIDKMALAPTQLMYGIFFDVQHIGHIKLASIKLLIFLIGASKWWEKVIASLAIAAINEIGFQQIGLIKNCMCVQ